MAATQAGAYNLNDGESHLDNSVPRMSSSLKTPQQQFPSQTHASYQPGKSSDSKLVKSGGTNGAGTSNGREKDRIWNTTTNEERERIKEFWLNLGEEERKSLVKVEKEAVLKKMKEQQKHSCSCSVCGRKRTAIEEELEVLYDAYYEELEQYANQQQFPSQSSITSSRQQLPRMPRHGRITEVLQSDSEGSFEDEDDLSEDDLLTDDDLSGEELEEDEEGYSNDEYEEDHAPPEFFKFGNSLTVKGGILTVADDLLKNDGKKFIEMMEQLAERRMQREEEAALEAREYDEAEDEDEDYDDEDIDSEDYDDDDEEQDTMTEEQRMAEGRRMFQIFAARMFEQRVLTAYREKVAQERQAQLLQELEMEDSREKEREAKKAKEKEKKKDKKRQQQLKKEEERARKEAERLAEEAALRAEEEKKAEEVRKRKEEQRFKREAEKKALEAEKQRKEEDKRKRVAEEKAREARRLEQVAREKKNREDAARKEREAKEVAAKEAKIRSQAAKVQRDADTNKNDQSRSPALPAPVSVISNTQKTSPPSQNSTSSVASPAVPKSTMQKESPYFQANRAYHDGESHSSGPRNIPPPQAQQQQHRAMTPGPISPQQYGSHQNSFPRAALGHPPSMPVPLPPPGIGVHGANNPNMDAFGFGTSQGHPHIAGQNGAQSRPVNGHAGPPMSGLQGPPGVFATAPGLKTSTSPQSRIGTPHGNRYTAASPFNAFSGLGSGTTSRDEPLHSEPDLTFSRRTSSLMDNSLSGIGAIGRPTPSRAASIVPAPIQRPSAIPPTKRTGFNTGDVMGSRALLDEDDPIEDNRITPSIFSSTSTWKAEPVPHKEGGFGSAALNGPIDEPYHPQRTANTTRSTTQSPFAVSGNDRWGSVGTIGNKSSTKTPSDDRFPPPPSKPINWAF
ncbi:Stress response protein nst1 [Taphrina deformans PYCC 5710]|uniref:Stress response protein NST1 n=1 Tax=Taphrina deformans (strain PYCC 5710 / ATCC 11124 / CBS 356.35 / IMI 108563 / JCM 9778 / NBRC 8474) TaxID=1097556 RepID=R4X993_TAPDE|nr:Stress response protein nst1 [Taphrina deformans PYCC 5710]|eukprot:CCG82291.1 Stress response protein nst1 [Taphrina deformans PYCC 5710]